MLNIARSFLFYMLTIFLFFKYIICINEPFFDVILFFSFMGVKFVIIQISVHDGGNSSGSRKTISHKRRNVKKGLVSYIVEETPSP